MRVTSVIGCALVLGCSSPRAPMEVTPAAGPSAVAGAFMQAVADSNLAQMGALWGTDRGPAASTNKPSNWIQRVTVMHSYLRGGVARVVGEAQAALSEDRRREVTVELTRGRCVDRIPFTMIQTRDGAWLVNAIDLNAAGVPGRPCQGRSGTPPGAIDFIQ